MEDWEMDLLTYLDKQAANRSYGVSYYIPAASACYYNGAVWDDTYHGALNANEWRDVKAGKYVACQGDGNTYWIEERGF